MWPRSAFHLTFLKCFSILYHLSMSPRTSNHFTNSTNKIKLYYAVKGSGGIKRFLYWSLLEGRDITVLTSCYIFSSVLQPLDPLHFHELMTFKWIKHKIPPLFITTISLLKDMFSFPTMQYFPYQVHFSSLLSALIYIIWPPAFRANIPVDTYNVPSTSI